MSRVHSTLTVGLFALGALLAGAGRADDNKAGVTYIGPGIWHVWYDAPPPAPVKSWLQEHSAFQAGGSLEPYRDAALAEVKAIVHDSTGNARVATAYVQDFHFKRFYDRASNEGSAYVSLQPGAPDAALRQKWSSAPPDVQAWLNTHGHLGGVEGAAINERCIQSDFRTIAELNPGRPLTALVHSQRCPNLISALAREPGLTDLLPDTRVIMINPAFQQVGPAQMAANVLPWAPPVSGRLEESASVRQLTRHDAFTAAQQQEYALGRNAAAKAHYLDFVQSVLPEVAARTNAAGWEFRIVQTSDGLTSPQAARHVAETLGGDFIDRTRVREIIHDIPDGNAGYVGQHHIVPNTEPLPHSPLDPRHPKAYLQTNTALEMIAGFQPPKWTVYADGEAGRTRAEMDAVSAFCRNWKQEHHFSESPLVRPLALVQGSGASADTLAAKVSALGFDVTRQPPSGITPDVVLAVKNRPETTGGASASRDWLPPRSTPVFDCGKIGGVMLRDTAVVKGLNGGDLAAAAADGDFSLIVKGSRVRLARRQLGEFITALWAVYYGNGDPGISIDPIEPGGKKHLVRYIGSVVNTDLGEVMREADYLAKQWAVGVNLPNIPGLKSVDDYAVEKGLGWRYLGAGNRIWFVPEAMRFRRCGDALLFDGGRMTLKTEYRVVEGKAARSEPAAEAFAEFFTLHYDEIAARFPVFQKLFDYAKLVSLAKFLKENGVPLHAFLMAHRDLILTADSVGTVDAFRKDSTHWAGTYIEGGVDLACKGSTYVVDAAAAKAIQEAMARIPRAQVAPGRPQDSRSAPSLAAGPASVEIGQNTYTVLPARSLAHAAGKLPARFQTDVALRRNGEPSIELVRHHDPSRKAPGAFGRGWDLLVPYRLEPTDAGQRRFLNAVIPNEIAVVDGLTGRREVLAFSRKVLDAAAYVPDDPKGSSTVGLFIMTDGSFRLLDKSRREFWFDRGWRLTDLLLSHRHHLGLSYDEAGRIVALRDGDRACVQLRYQGDRVVAAELPDGRQVRYAYEGDRLARVTYPDGRELKLACAGTGPLPGAAAPEPLSRLLAALPTGAGALEARPACARAR